jgi:hypothetical protein
MSTPTFATWKIQSQTGLDGLVFEENAIIPDKLEDHACLIAIEASSLNYRDITIPMVNVHSPRPSKSPPTTNLISRALTPSPSPSL